MNYVLLTMLQSCHGTFIHFIITHGLTRVNVGVWQRTAFSIICDPQHQAQQTLGVLPFFQQHLCITWQPQKQAKGCQRVSRDWWHGLYWGRGGGGGGLGLLLVDGRWLSSNGLRRLIHQLARLLNGYPLKLVTVLGLLLCGGGHHWGADLFMTNQQNTD